MSPPIPSGPIAAAPCGLPILEARLRQDLAWLELPAKEWVPRQPGVIDVAIVGAGMAGLAACASIRHLGMRATVFDRAAAGFEGPWATTARMQTLRSPKHLTGPALGLPALTFRAWFEAQFGGSEWEALDKIPRLQWMDYLRWYRRVLDLDVRSRHAVTAVQPRDDGLVSLAIESPGGRSQVLARRVVLATGRDGLGAASVPVFVERLPRACWAHSSDDMDYAVLAGKRVAVIGAGASAMDCAATALEAGAAVVELLIRRDDIPRINKGKGAGNPGFNLGFVDLPDPWKWRLRHYMNVEQAPPPRGSTLRVSRHPNAHFNLGCAVLDIEASGETLILKTTTGRFTVDFLIAATGFAVDWSRRPEFAAFAAQVRTWADRFTPVRGQEDQELADSPDLGPAFEFQAKGPGLCPGLDRVHCFCHPATASHGMVSGDIPAISDGARRLAEGLASLFYREDIERQFEALQAYADPEVFGDEWQRAAPPDRR